MIPRPMASQIFCPRSPCLSIQLEFASTPSKPKSTGNRGMLLYDPVRHVSARHFCQELFPPSRVFQAGRPSPVPWLYVHNKHFQRHTRVREEATAACQQLKRQYLAQPCKTVPLAERLLMDIHQLAAEHGYASGKWLLNISEEASPHVWQGIVEGTYDSSLGASAAKIGRRSTQSEFLACVYHENYEDTAALSRLLDNLRSLDISLKQQRNIKFKADILTDCGIYSDFHSTVPISRWSSRHVPP